MLLKGVKGVRLKFWNFLYYWSDLTEIFAQYVKSKKKTLFVHETFSIWGLVFFIYIQIYICIKKNRTASVFMQE